MTTFGQDGPKEQNFYGSGLAFGGDNKGIVNNVLLDPKTRAYLADMSEKAPELAALLRRALRDGLISPDVAQALLLAAQNINEDVAQALLVAGSNINEDVAINLMIAGQNINEKVAEKIICANRELGDTARDLDSTLSSLREIVGQLSSPHRGRNLHSELESARIVNGNSRQIAVAGTMVSSSRSVGRWRFIGTLICGSFGAGLLAAVILMRSHLGGYAVFAGVIVLLFAAILQSSKARR
jgi:hypothetical protein